MHGFGQASDMIKFAPEGAADRRSSTTGAPYYISRVKAVLDGTWKSTDDLGRHQGRRRS